ncbi:RsbT co-antagonist protein RsbRD [Lentibacillus sp. JNUCC-1]|uniref:STAS domain-containing protein n=1 Tax=Lentibacillus sp. JNUCC-1 TaxID=2654513 RepID=UPI0012E93574|nr:STAS domain-containing protein [Lentibacillus sp. JNUCC-1]MUV37741.1 RsbT co-antagonist protein RsbRD [Lentibacillus sp. JNUCC-1]
MISRLDSLYPLPAYIIDENLDIQEASAEAIEMFGESVSLFNILERGSHDKAKKWLHPDQGKVKVELNLHQPESSTITLADCYAGWKNEHHGEILVITKNQDTAVISSQLKDLRTRLQDTDIKLLQEKEHAEALLKENNRLSAPFIKVTEDIGLIPIFGTLNEEKVAAVQERILHHVYHTDASQLIFDFTAVNDVTIEGLSQFKALFQTIKILGKHINITGIKPDLAKQLHHLNLPLHMTYQSSLAHMIRKLI